MFCFLLLPSSSLTPPSLSLPIPLPPHPSPSGKSTFPTCPLHSPWAPAMFTSVTYPRVRLDSLLPTLPRRRPSCSPLLRIKPPPPPLVPPRYQSFKVLKTPSSSPPCPDLCPKCFVPSQLSPGTDPKCGAATHSGCSHAALVHTMLSYLALSGFLKTA